MFAVGADQETCTALLAVAGLTEVCALGDAVAAADADVCPATDPGCAAAVDCAVAPLVVLV